MTAPAAAGPAMRQHLNRAALVGAAVGISAWLIASLAVFNPYIGLPLLIVHFAIGGMVFDRTARHFVDRHHAQRAGWAIVLLTPLAVVITARLESATVAAAIVVVVLGASSSVVGALACYLPVPMSWTRRGSHDSITRRDPEPR